MKRYTFLVAFLFAAAGPLLTSARAEAEEPGELRLADAVVTLSEQVDVPARSAGVLAELSVREGDRVKSGQPAATIDDVEARLAVEHAEVDLASARSEAANELKILATEKATAAARAELQRASESSAKYSKSISDTELDRLRLTAEKSELEHRQARHERDLAQLKVKIQENELAAARRKLELHRIAAPADGVVVEIKRRRGEWVEPGMAVLRIVTMDPLRVEAFLEARSVRPQLVGARASFHVAGNEAQSPPVEGRVTFVSPEIDPINGQVRIWAEIPNADGRLRPGLQGTLVIGAQVPAPEAKPAAQKRAEPIAAPARPAPGGRP